MSITEFAAYCREFVGQRHGVAANLFAGDSDPNLVGTGADASAQSVFDGYLSVFDRVAAILIAETVANPRWSWAYANGTLGCKWGAREGSMRMFRVGMTAALEVRTPIATSSYLTLLPALLRPKQTMRRVATESVAAHIGHPRMSQESRPRDVEGEVEALLIQHCLIFLSSVYQNSSRRS